MITSFDRAVLLKIGFTCRVSAAWDLEEHDVFCTNGAFAQIKSLLGLLEKHERLCLGKVLMTIVGGSSAK